MFIVTIDICFLYFFIQVVFANSACVFFVSSLSSCLLFYMFVDFFMFVCSCVRICVVDELSVL